MLGKIKHNSKDKRTMRSSDPIIIDNQIIELPLEINDHCSNAQIAAHIMRVKIIPFLAYIPNSTYCSTYNDAGSMKDDSLEQGLKSTIR